MPVSCSDKIELPYFLLGPRPLVDSASCSEMPWHGPRPEEHGLPGLGSHRGCRTWPHPERDTGQEDQKGKRRNRPLDPATGLRGSAWAAALPSSAAWKAWGPGS